MSRRNKQANQKQPAKPEATLLAQQSFYQGQLPPPEMMQHFQQILPDLPERIVKMAEREQIFRHTNESKYRKGFIISTYLGMIFGFLALLIACGLVFYAFYLDHATEGAAMATAIIVGVPAVFIYRRRIRKYVN